MAGRNEQQARRGTIFAAYLKLLPFFIFLIPGLIAYVLHAKGQLTLPLNADGQTDYNAAFPAMVEQIMPMGLRGLLAGGLLAALMASLASVYNACSTLFTMDIYQKMKPEAGEKELVRVGRIATGVVVILGMIWIPMMGRISSTLYTYLQSVQSSLWFRPEDREEMRDLIVTIAARARINQQTKVVQAECAWSVPSESSSSNPS